jgi:TolB protein
MSRALHHAVATYLVTSLTLGCMSCQQDGGDPASPGGSGGGEQSSGGGGGGQSSSGPELPPVPPAGTRGAIAYVRGRSEIHLVAADGSNDRRIWTHPQAGQVGELGITGLAWRPDGGEIAFTSGHEAVTSLYQSDVWAVTPDGSRLRKLTNAPAHADLAKYPQGTVTVTVKRAANDVTGDAASGTYTVYVVGARDPQSVTLPPGGTTTLTFANVADLGAVAQPVVAMYAKWRWLGPGADVRAGATAQAATLTISGVDVVNFGAAGPGWRADGSQIGYVVGDCAGIFRVPATSAPAIGGTRLGTDDDLDTCSWDWGPTAATASQVVHGSAFNDPTIYRMTESGTRTPLLERKGMIVDVRWLPDASGIAFVETDDFYATANLYRHDFTSGKTTQLTSFQYEVIRAISLSPDGKSVVLERARSLFDKEERPDLWVVGIDGSGLRLLVKDGQSPAW